MDKHPVQRRVETLLVTQSFPPIQTGDKRQCGGTLASNTHLTFPNVSPSPYVLPDVTPPSFENSCPSDILVSLNINGSAEANWTIPIATDNSGIAPAVNVSPIGVRPPYKFNETSTVTYTAVDSNGNVAPCTFRIRVEGKTFHYYSVSCKISRFDLSVEKQLVLRLLRYVIGLKKLPPVFHPTGNTIVIRSRTFCVSYL